MAEEFHSAPGSPAVGESFSLRHSHIFNLGDDENVRSVVNELIPELEMDASEGIPMPYLDISEVSKLDGRWVLDRVVQVCTGQEKTKNMFLAYKRTIHDGLILADGVKLYDCFTFVRIEEGGAEPLMWTGFRTNATKGRSWGWVIDVLYPGSGSTLLYQGSALEQTLANNSSAICLQTTFISHPMNYIVKVTPALTSKEERKVQAGKKTPIPKSPHFIVIDHDVLVSMRPCGNGGTHASPVPHHRRGHWKRLSERCKFARMMGKEKVFVKSAYVGDRWFSDGKNLYEVLL